MLASLHFFIIMSTSTENKQPALYVRAHHGVCHVEKEGCTYVQHSVALAGWYIPKEHSIYPFAAMGRFDLAEAMEGIYNKGMDYTQFTKPTVGKFFFHPTKALPSTATAVVLELTKLQKLGEETTEVSMKISFGFKNNENRWEVNTKDLALTALPGFFGLNAQQYTEWVNHFCGSEVARHVIEPKSVIQHREDRNIVVFKKAKPQKNAVSVLSGAEVAKSMSAVQYPASSQKVSIDSKTLEVHAWYNSMFKAAIFKQLAEAGINTTLLARIPVYDFPMTLHDGRLPQNLEYEIRRCLAKQGHAYSYDEINKCYYAVHSSKLQDQTDKQKAVSFATYANHQHKFLQRATSGYQGSIWD